MRIYIDEAGAFVVPPAGADSFSLVLSLTIPSSVEPHLFYDFLRLRDEWPVKGIEIKGSSLDETQTAQVIQVCRRHDVLVNFVALNTATHDDLLVDDFKRRQADALLAHLTPEHQPSMVQSLKTMADDMRKMPNQLFLQAFATMELLLGIVEETTVYYVQRIPEELADISWVIDRKDKTITQMEHMWSTLILPMSETYFARRPFAALAGADYSHFDKRYTFTQENVDPEMDRHMKWLKEIHGLRAFNAKDRGVNAGRLFQEQREFKDSRDSLGIQLADILASTLRRALNGKLKIEGWGEFGQLIVRRRNTGSYFIQLGPGITPVNAPSVCYVLDRTAKSMILD